MPLDPALTEFTTVSPVLTSFTFTEEATATSYLTVYGCAEQNNGSYFLTQNILDSENPKTTDTSNFELNFDLAFAKNLTIEGDLYVSWSLEALSGATNTSTIEIFHVNSGATETTIGTQVAGKTIGTEGRSARNLTKFTIARKQFKIGEFLRIEIVITTSGGSGSTLWHDPANRSQTEFNDIQTNTVTNSTNLIMFIPVKTNR